MRKIGPLLIMAAASLWAIDAIFRTNLTYTIPSSAIVFFEHLIGFVFLSPFLFRDIKSLKELKSKDWMVIIAMCTLSSVLGTLLFTQALNLSFAAFDFATPILLQKLQPVFVVLLSAIFLKEKITKSFVFWAALALVGSYLLSFGFNPVKLELAGKELVYVLAIGAAFAWGAGTIMSKFILDKLKFMTASALRFGFAIPIAFLAMILTNQTFNFMDLDLGQIIRFLVIGGITGGALAIYIYYKGLKTTPAKVSTFAELAFPLVSIVIAVTSLNPYGEPQLLNMGNIVGIVLLLISIFKISYDKAVNSE